MERAPSCTAAADAVADARIVRVIVECDLQVSLAHTVHLVEKHVETSLKTKPRKLPEKEVSVACCQTCDVLDLPD